jgi:phosphatidylinositol glycan class B
MNLLFKYFFNKFDIDQELQLFYCKLFKISLALMLVASFFSTGYHHYDEQWQVLEFMGIKLGLTSKDLMPWEYVHKMRSWAQPFVHYLITKIFFLDNPFSMAWAYRIFTALVGWYSLCLLSISSVYLYSKKSQVRLATYCLIFCWFSPYLRVRPSSEGLSSSVFVIGLAWLISELYSKKETLKFSKSILFWSGFVCGLSFLFRFQLGLMIFSTWLWMVFLSDVKLKDNILFAFGVCLAVVVELPIDMWGYETLTFAPWNYYYQNLVLNKVAGFPTAPWWYYFSASLKRGIPPISLILIIVQVLFWTLRPKSIFTWSMISLFIIHTLIPTKALRFIFPIMVVTPLFIPFVHSYMCEKLSIYNKFSHTKFASFLFSVLLTINGVLFIQTSLRSSKSAVDLYQYVYNNNDTIKKIYHYGESPYQNVGLELMFYRPKDIILEKIAETTAVESLFTDNKNFWFMSKKGGSINTIVSLGCTIKKMTYPQWVLKFNFFNWVERSRVWTLFYCEGK